MQRYCAKSAAYSLILAVVGFGAHATALAESPRPPDLQCVLGPLQESFAKTPWLVYGCNDRHSIIIVTAPGNPAMPFYFAFSWTQQGYVLHGEGTGSKSVTDSAFSELKTLKEADITRLYEEAVAAGRSGTIAPRPARPGRAHHG